LQVGFRNDLTLQEDTVSIAPVPSNPNTHQPSAAQVNPKPIRQDFQNLAAASTAANLAGARDAFSAVQQLLQANEPGKASQAQGSGNKPKNQLGTDLVAFGKAIMSGDLGSAQDSVKSLLGDIQAARGRYQGPTQGGQGAINSITPSERAIGTTGSKSVGSLINTTA
jgi:hypothetical protein